MPSKIKYGFWVAGDAVKSWSIFSMTFKWSRPVALEAKPMDMVTLVLEFSNEGCKNYIIAFCKEIHILKANFEQKEWWTGKIWSFPVFRVNFWNWFTYLNIKLVEELLYTTFSISIILFNVPNYWLLASFSVSKATKFPEYVDF